MKLSSRIQHALIVATVASAVATAFQLAVFFVVDLLPPEHWGSRAYSFIVRWLDAPFVEIVRVLTPKVWHTFGNVWLALLVVIVSAISYGLLCGIIAGLVVFCSRTEKPQ